MDAKLQLDGFQRQHDQIHKSHLDLIGMGRSISSEIDQSYRGMFGELESGRVHPAVEGVETLVVQMVQACQVMEGVARPCLQQLKQRHQYHIIKQKWSKVRRCPKATNKKISDSEKISDLHECSFKKFLNGVWSQGTREGGRG